MNQDIFVEQIIQRRRSGTDYLIYVGLSLAFLVICFLGLFVIPMFGFLVIIAAGYGMYWVVTSRNLEFEYSVTNGDLTIDRIINRQRRKRVISFDCKDVEAIGKYKAVDHQSKHYDKKFFASLKADGSDEGAWYITVRSAKYGGLCLVVFNPEERVLDSILPFLPRQLAFEVFGTGDLRVSLPSRDSSRHRSS